MRVHLDWFKKTKDQVGKFEDMEEEGWQEIKQKQIVRQINNNYMIKRYYQRRETKCNFCFQWFSSECILKNSIHLCGPCIDKALNTTCYKVPSPDGKQFYQLYLFRNNLRVSEQPEEPELQSDIFKNNLIENIDEYRNQQLKKLSQKWAEITNELHNLPNVSEQDMKSFLETFNDCIRNYPTASQILQHRNRKPEHQQSPTMNPSEPSIIKQDHERGPAPEHSSNELAPLERGPLLEIQKDANKSQSYTDSGKSCGKNEKPQRNSLKSRNDGSSKLQENEKSKLNRDSSQESLLCVNFKKKQEFIPYSKQKRQKDLQLIAQNALKSKIYNYLENYSSVPPALYLPMTLDIYDAIQNTSCLNRCIELVSHSLQDIDIKCYLNMLEWSGADILKLVKVGLSDEQFKQVINFVKDKKVETLVVTSNRLTEQSVAFVGENGESLARMKNLYLGRNRIQKFKVREVIKQIENKFVLYL